MQRNPCSSIEIRLSSLFQFLGIVTETTRKRCCGQTCREFRAGIAHNRPRGHIIIISNSARILGRIQNTIQTLLKLANNFFKVRKGEKRLDAKVRVVRLETVEFKSQVRDHGADEAQIA